MEIKSDRLKQLPPYLFSVIDEKKKDLKAKGVDVIDLGIGAPDLSTPPFIIERLVNEVYRTENHRYSPFAGCEEFRIAVASFYKRNYDVDLDPDTEILTLIGSKEGLVHLISALINTGDSVIIPDPGYPVYQAAVQLAGGQSIPLPLKASNHYIPNFSHLPSTTMKRAKLMLLNYPSNPTGATVELDTFREAIQYARQYQIIIAHDAAYSHVTFDDYKAPSIMQIDGAKSIAIELGSLSKSFNMTGWRIGYVVGNPQVIKALSILKSNLDTSQFLPIQKAAATALMSDFSTVRENNRIYAERLELVVSALREMNLECLKPRGSFYVWAKVPKGLSSSQFAEKLLEDAGIVVTPGHAFGKQGEGYFRISLTVNIERLKEAIGRMRDLDWGETTS